MLLTRLFLLLSVRFNEADTRAGYSLFYVVGVVKWSKSEQTRFSQENYYSFLLMNIIQYMDYLIFSIMIKGGAKTKEVVNFFIWTE